MKEEFTTPMHSAMGVFPDTDILHRCFSALTLLPKDANDKQIKEIADIYQVTIEQIKEAAPKFNKLKNQ